MTKLHPPHKLEIRDVPTMGLGVFTTKYVSRGEVLEECKLLTLPVNEGDMSSTILMDYRFNYPAGANPFKSMVVALGYGSLYNHSNSPNVIWENHPNRSDIFIYRAITDIPPNKQCFVYYGNDEYP